MSLNEKTKVSIGLVAAVVAVSVLVGGAMSRLEAVESASKDDRLILNQVNERTIRIEAESNYIKKMVEKISQQTKEH